jgi:hypothetical protein
MDYDAELNFTIPPPPLVLPGVTLDASRHKTSHFHRKDYGYAWVPSANATFPPGYDPRISQAEGQTVSEHRQANELYASPSSASLSASTSVVPLASKTSSAISASNSLEQNETGDVNMGKTVSIYNPSKKVTEKVWVRQYKPKGPPPRFVPRQVKEKPSTPPSKPEEKAIKIGVKTQDAKKSADDEINRQIRREAFSLGDDQGPSLPSDPEERKRILGTRPVVDPSVEASVVTSVKAIRKRLSAAITQSVAKKMKTAGEENKTCETTSEDCKIAKDTTSSS